MDFREKFDVQAYVSRQMHLHEDQYCVEGSIEMQLITLNINKKRSCDKIADLIKPGKQFVAIVLQEVDMSLNAIMAPQSQKGSGMMRIFEEQSEYPHVDYQQFGSILLVVMYKDGIQVSFRPGISCGYMNKLGNKGMISARIQAGSTRILIVAGHLSADRSENGCFRRNNDLIQIFKQLQPWDRWHYGEDAQMFDDFVNDGEITASIQNCRQEQPLVAAFDSVEYVYLMGDLNFRVNNVDDIQSFMAGLLDAERRYFDDILLNDQLSMQLAYLEQIDAPIPFDTQISLQNTQRQSMYCPSSDELELSASTNATPTVFDDQQLERPVVKQMDYNVKSVYAVGALQGFLEDRISFSPTYKILPGGQYKPDRVPSYCDRILYRVARGGALKSSRYYSPRHVLIGDHFPVVLEQELAIRTPDKARQDECKKRFLGYANLIQNYLVPQFRISAADLQFAVSEGCFCSAMLSFENTHKMSPISLVLDVSALPRGFCVSAERLRLDPGATAQVWIGCMFNRYLALQTASAAFKEPEQTEYIVPISALYAGQVQSVQCISVRVRAEEAETNACGCADDAEVIPERLRKLGDYIYSAVNLARTSQQLPQLQSANSNSGNSKKQSPSSQMCQMLEMWRTHGVYAPQIATSEEKLGTVMSLLGLAGQSDYTAADPFYCAACLYAVLCGAEVANLSDADELKDLKDLKDQKRFPLQLQPLKDALLRQIAAELQAASVRQRLGFWARADFARFMNQPAPLPIYASPRAVLECVFNEGLALAPWQCCFSDLPRVQQAIPLFLAACVHYYSLALDSGKQAAFREDVFRFWDQHLFPDGAHAFFAKFL